jgi:hypothetical protein
MAEPREFGASARKESCDLGSFEATRGPVRIVFVVGGRTFRRVDDVIEASGQRSDAGLGLGDLVSDRSFELVVLGGGEPWSVQGRSC